jgi:hypothetical protein
MNPSSNPASSISRADVAVVTSRHREKTRTSEQGAKTIGW